MNRLCTVAFWLLAATLLACQVIVTQHSLSARFWEDEAFNLTVPLNLLDGYGYASDGALSGSTITPFDPRISTGPTVLLPVAAVLAFGADPVLSARLVPLLFWLALTAGLAVLGHRIGGRWAALVGSAAPLAFNGLGSVSPIQGPTDLLGEVPAAALLVWALVVLPRRSWLAGLLVGLAVQAKLIALLALPAFAVALWVLAPGRGMQRIVATLRRSWLPLLLAGTPTLLVEIGALLSLGASGFVDHLRALRDFVRGGGQQIAPTTAAQKLETLAGAWFVPTWAAGVVAAVCVVLILVGLVVAHRQGFREREPAMLAAAAGVGALAFVVWWSTASHTPLWVRHPAPGVLAFFPVLVIVAIWSARVLVLGARRSEPFTAERSHAVDSKPGAPPADGSEEAREDQRPVPQRVLAVALAAALIAPLAAGVTGHVLQTLQPRGETLATQRADAEIIGAWVEETGTVWLAAQPWGAAIAPVVMSGAHVGLFDAAAMRGVPRLTGMKCETEPLVEGRRYRVCAAPDAR